MAKVSGYLICPKCVGTNIYLKLDIWIFFFLKKWQKSDDKYILLLSDEEGKEIWVNHILWEDINDKYEHLNYICDAFGTMNASERAEEEEYRSRLYREDLYTNIPWGNSSEKCWNIYGGSTKKQWIDIKKEWRCQNCNFISPTFLDFQRLVTIPTNRIK